MDRKQASQATTGLIIVAVGLTLLAGQLNLGWAWDLGRLWPVFLIAIGLARFVNPGEDGRGTGIWFMFMGAIFMLHTSRVLRLNDSWPLFIVATGVSMLFKRDRPREPGATNAGTPSSQTPIDTHSTGGRFQS